MDRKCIARGGAPVKAADALVEALGGDPRSGMCCCPAHDDDNPSLHVSEGLNGKILVHCFAGCSQDAVLDALRARGLWQATRPTRWRSDEERREYALKQALKRRDDALKLLADPDWGRAFANLLGKYFARRGIKTVPSTALFVTPGSRNSLGLIPGASGMVFPVIAVIDGYEEILGAHVTWLSRDLTSKRDREPVRQCFGPVGGGYIKLYDGDLPATAKLVIAEGVETAMAAAQIAGGLPAIAALSAANLPNITPPPAGEYIIAADHDEAGLRGARALANKLAAAGRVVRLAVPPTPGFDWNDELKGGL